MFGTRFDLRYNGEYSPICERFRGTRWMNENARSLIMNQLICESSMQNGSINTVQGRAFTAASVLERKVFVCVLTAFQRIESSSALFFLFLSRISRDLVIRR